ncbi:MFS transporter [Actinoallomurus sp. CA-142502]|uniref:MFS transporter n=1 Tax=Actinoallomurus sp. CA-142502 TaxID=3239885 RepID=UPI003D94CAE8
MEMTIGPRAGRREWIGLAVLALPTLLVSLDTFVMVMALPTLSTELGADSTQQLWIMDVYGFMVAGFLITMGTLGDRIGRRRLLMIGAAAFGAASVLAAFSTGPGLLIFARALLGIAGATLTPSTLAMIMNMFHDARQRASAIGLWAGCFTVGAVIGPLVGGVLLERFWWGSLFLLGVPAMVLLLLVGPLLLPEYRDPGAGRIDVPSVVLSLGAILPVVYGLKETARSGLHPLPAVALAIGAAVGAVFLRRQRRLADPLLDLSLFTNKAFAVTLGAMLTYAMLSGGTMTFVSQHFQLVDHLSPLQAGLALLPGMIAAMVGFQLSPLLARRIRPVPLIPIGLAITAAGMLIVTRSGAGSGLTVLVIGFAVSCLGAGPLVSLGTNLVVGSVPPAKAGSAAGIAQTGNEFGYALGIAVLGSIGTAVYRGRMTGHAGAAHDSLVGATETAAHLGHGPATAVLDTARAAFSTELHAIAFISAAALTCVAVLITGTLRHLQPVGGDDHEVPATEVREPVHS